MADVTENKVKPGVYVHFKGGVYHVLGVAEDTETHTQTVIYIPQSGSYAGLLRSRPVTMFIEHVDRNDFAYSGPRFKLVSERDFLGEIK